MSQTILLAIGFVMMAVSFVSTIGDVLRRSRTSIAIRIGKHDYKITGRTTTDQVVAMLKKEFSENPRHGRRRKLT